MTKTKIYRSEMMATIHQTASGLHDIGLMDKKTLKKFDELCLTPIQPLSPQEIREIREKEDVSQTVFARYLNVSPGLISQWERGEKRPSGASLKLLTLVKNKGIHAIA